MKNNKGLIALTVAAVLMFGGATASDVDAERLEQLIRNVSTKPTTNDIEMARELKLPIDEFMKYQVHSDADSILALAKNSPFDVNAIADVAIRLKTIGFSIRGYLRPLVDGIAHFGGNSSGLHQAVFAVQQMVTKKQVSMEEISRLDEVIPNASALLNKSVFKHLNHLYGIILD